MEILSQLVKSIPTALLLLDRQGVIIESNQCAVECLRLPSLFKNNEHVITQILPDLSITDHETQEIELITENEGTRFLKIDVGPLHYKGSSYYIVSIINITPLVLQTQELKRSNEDLDQFAYTASHDLREPLRGMRNFARFLEEDYFDRIDDDGRQYVKTIQKLGRRLESYLDSLLYYSKLGREEMGFKMVQLESLVEDIRISHLDSSQKNTIVSFSSSSPLIHCDPIKLTKVIGNLMQNAVRYNKQEIKTISITHSPLDDKKHQFWVKDNGIGIRSEDWARIFTLFKRLHPKERFEEGNGIGLTMAKKAVQRHEGDI